MISGSRRTKAVEVEVWTDIICPWSYIGKRRLEAALRRLDTDRVDVVWRSFELDGDAAGEPGPTTVEVMAKYGGDRQAVLRRFAWIEDLGRAEGLDLNLTSARPVNSFDAHRLTHLAAGRNLRERMTERLLRAYHTENLDIADLDTLLDLARESGVPYGAALSVLDGDGHAAEVAADEERAVELGIRGVPAFVVGGVPSAPGVPSVADLSNLLEQALSKGGRS